MRRISVLAIIAVAGVAVSGCTTTRQMADAKFRPPAGQFRIIVMQPDISVGLLTAGGTVEPRQDWTDQARTNVLTALNAQQVQRGGDVTIARTQEDAGGDPQAVADLVFLHNAVGQAIRTHKYGLLPLPTKAGKFDWTLGPQAVDYGLLTQYDYALFMHAQDSFSSGGRVALQALSLVGCAFGVCAMPTGGQQVAFASLVELKSGQVVWFNVLSSTVGDIRTPEGAKSLVDDLLATMKPGAPAMAKKKKNTRA